MMRKSKMLIPFALISLGAGAYMYSYAKKHPVKTQVAIERAKDIMKDLK